MWEKVHFRPVLNIGYFVCHKAVPFGERLVASPTPHHPLSCVLRTSPSHATEDPRAPLGAGTRPRPHQGRMNRGALRQRSRLSPLSLAWPGPGPGLAALLRPHAGPGRCGSLQPAAAAAGPAPGLPRSRCVRRAGPAREAVGRSIGRSVCGWVRRAVRGAQRRGLSPAVPPG